MRITLNKPHTHAGRDHEAGATINVNAIEGDWLIALRVGDSASATETTKPALANTTATVITGE